MGSGAGLSADMLLGLFDEVDAELEGHGEPLSILIVGGAAMAGTAPTTQIWASCRHGLRSRLLGLQCAADSRP